MLLKSDRFMHGSLLTPDHMMLRNWMNVKWCIDKDPPICDGIKNEEVIDYSKDVPKFIKKLTFDIYLFDWSNVLFQDKMHCITPLTLHTHSQFEPYMMLIWKTQRSFKFHYMSYGLNAWSSLSSGAWTVQYISSHVHSILKISGKSPYPSVRYVANKQGYGSKKNKPVSSGFHVTSPKYSILEYLSSRNAGGRQTN